MDVPFASTENPVYDEDGTAGELYEDGDGAYDNTGYVVQASLRFFAHEGL